MALRGIYALASFDSQTGDLRRYERDGSGGLRVTHVAGLLRANDVEPGIVEAFRDRPPSMFSTRQYFIRQPANEPDLTPCA